MAWTDPVDLYCERLGPGFWAEPVNALSNAGFVLVGLVFLRMARAGRADPFVQVLCLWVAVIGVGSFLFHTLATRWASLLDVVPIGSFVVTYVAFALRRFLGLGWPGAVLALLAFVLGSWGLMALVPDSAFAATNGSVQYLPAVLALVVFVVALARAGSPAWSDVALAGTLFAVSLAFRSLDLAACPLVPVGTHWAWHLLNAALLAVLLRAAVRHASLDRSPAIP